MLAMVVNDDVGRLTPRGVLGCIASMPQAGARSYRSYDDTPSHPSPPPANPLTYLLTVLPLRSYKGACCTTTYNKCGTKNKSKKLW